MDMGLGKTRTAIELVVRRQGKFKRVVWFTLVSLMTTAVEEFKKHTDITDADIYEFDDKTRPCNLPRDRFLYVVGLESMGASDRVVLAVADLVDEETFVVVDESSYIKGHMAKRTVRITRLSEKARYRLILTGTPLSQGVVDLYAQMRFLSPQILGYKSFYSFAANHLEYSKLYPGMIVQAHNTGWLAQKIAPYVYQCTKEEVADLPAKIRNTVWHRMTDRQEELYGQAKVEILLRLYDEERGLPEMYVIFQLFNALRQIASGFWNRYDKAGSILERIVVPTLRPTQLLSLVGSADKEIVWTEYSHSTAVLVEALRQEMGNTAVCQIHGGLGRRERDEEIERWRGQHGRVLVATTGTGGHGLNLTEGTHSIFYEHQFKYSHRIQAEDRTHRIGQTVRPTYTDIMCAGTIDQRILRSLGDKEDVVARFRRRVEQAKGDREAIAAMIAEL
jgi:SNF2 family DNA or RNA helicase